MAKNKRRGMISAQEQTAKSQSSSNYGNPNAPRTMPSASDVEMGIDIAPSSGSGKASKKSAKSPPSVPYRDE